MLPAIIKNAIIGAPMDLPKTIQILVSFAERARREGLLALEEQARDIDDPFLQKGIQLAVDGTDPELVPAILETEIAYLGERHTAGASILSTMGGFAPTLGVIGTVAGLVHMMANLSDPGSMGPAIASAFIATLYGVSSANLVFLPLGNKLKQRNGIEILLREIQIEGILSIQAGDNPRVVEEKLKAFLDPKARASIVMEAHA
jgi:chemotaxis protein MotA